MSFFHKSLEGLSWALQGAGAKEPQERVGGQHLAPFNSAIARMQSGARKWGKAPARAKGVSWMGRAGVVNPTSQGTENEGQILYSSAWKRGEQRHKWKKACRPLRGTDGATSLHYYKIQEASKEATCSSWTAFPVLSGQHSPISRNLVSNASPFQVFRGLEYMALNIMFKPEATLIPL